MDSQEKPPLAEATCQRVLMICRICAAHRGLKGEALQDCALGFLEDMLGKHLALFLPPPAPLPEPWLCRCANRWVGNVLRLLRRQRHREVSLTTLSQEQMRDWEDYLPGNAPSPEQMVLKAEFYETLYAAVESLSLLQQELFLRRIVEETPIPILAQTSGQAPNTLYQEIWALRQRLRWILSSQGLDQREIRDYLYLLARLQTQPAVIGKLVEGVTQTDPYLADQ